MYYRGLIPCVLMAPSRCTAASLARRPQRHPELGLTLSNAAAGAGGGLVPLLARLGQHPITDGSIVIDTEAEEVCISAQPCLAARKRRLSGTVHDHSLQVSSVLQKLMRKWVWWDNHVSATHRHMRRLKRSAWVVQIARIGSAGLPRIDLQLRS